MVFGEVSYREPVRLRRPDRDRGRACVAYEVPGPDDLPIFLDRRPADAIERHALRDTSVELGGILLGRECLDDETGEPFVWVTEAVEAKHYENTQASFTYTHDSWQEITRERDRLHPDLDIVGWYHTHPDFGIFLSGHDLFIHRNFFDQPLQVAYVVDPIRQTRGFFRWKDGGLDQVRGFFLSAERSDRAALARLANDLEGLPNADSGGGGGLSPRLEAELIAMLTRPSYQAQAPSERGQLAAVAGAGGLLVGVLGLGAVLWVNSLTNQVREQADRIKGLDVTLRGNTEMQRMALDALLQKAEAGGPNVGGDPFSSAYRKALTDRDDYRSRVETLRYATEGLASDKKALALANEALAKRLEAAELLAKEADTARALRADLEKQAAKLASTEATLARKEELLSTVDPEKAAGLISRAKWGTIVAVASSVVALIAIAGLVVLWGNRPASDGRFETPPGPAEPPPHVIT